MREDFSYTPVSECGLMINVHGLKRALKETRNSLLEFAMVSKCVRFSFAVGDETVDI